MRHIIFLLALPCLLVLNVGPAEADVKFESDPSQVGRRRLRYARCAPLLIPH